MESALTLAKRIKNKDLTSSQLVQQTIAKIEEKNPSLNAVIRTRYDKALQAAQAIDAQGHDGLFAGVPILLKDLGQELRGEINSSGSRLFQNYRSTHTDTFTQKLQNLGFIVLGQTATPEYGFKNYTQSQAFGTTYNAWDPHRHAGGSSGGAASAVASGMLPLAAASDGGGSIRIPASWQGIVGLKPSRGRMPVGPASYRGWQGASVHFALASHLEDVEALFYALQVEQLEAPFPLPLLKREPGPSSGSLKGWRIAYSLQSPVGTAVDSAVLVEMERALALLAELGAQLVEVDWPVDGQRLIDSYYVMNSVETAAMVAGIEEGLGRVLTSEDMEPQSWLIYQAGRGVPAAQYSRILSYWDQESAAVWAFHQDFDLFVTPATATVAPLVADYGVEPEKWASYMGRLDSLSQRDKILMVHDLFKSGLERTPFNYFANITGQPSISLPLFLVDGLPVGLQATAAKGREDKLFALAHLLEPYFTTLPFV